MASFLHVSPLHVSLLPHTCHTPHPSHSSLFSRSNNIRGGTQVINLCRVHLTLNPLLLPLPLPLISPSTSYSRISLAHVLPSVSEAELHTHTKHSGARNVIPLYNPINTLRTGSFKLFKRPFPGFLTILTL
jgi:hypothetical protein